MPKRVLSAPDGEEDVESINNPNASKRTRKAAEEPEINEICQKFYDALRTYKSEDERIPYENFIRLPSKRTHGEYYNIIKQPIDFIRIQQKIRTDEYQNFEQFAEDVEILLGNAKNFYRKNSNEWRDANELLKYFHMKKQEFPQRRRLSRRNQDFDQEEFEGNRKKRINRQSDENVNNGTKIKNEQEESNSSNSTTSVDSYLLEEFFTAIYNANIHDRPMSDIFLFLPSRKLYPDYYLIVSQPIDFKMIAMKIQHNQYSSLDEMENDLSLMISNAKKYNDPKSQIYKDASALKKMITSVRNELETALKSSKVSNDRLRLRKRDVLLSFEIANMNYPEEPEDEDVIQMQQKNDDGADSDTSSLGVEEDSFRVLYNTVKSYKLGAQSLIDPFMKLPNRRFHQDYYEEIQRPIAMSLIKKHIKKGRYNDLSDLVDDLKLMFNNAMQYNQEGSLIYNSAKKLLDVALTKAHELGHDEDKPKLKEARVHIPPIDIKDEYFDSFSNHQTPPRNRSSLPEVSSNSPSSNSQRNRPSKKILKSTEQNIQMLFDFIREFQEDDVDLIEPFLKLPSASEYPDYYESIENPIDMSMIKEKIDKGLYKSEQELVADFHLMFSNAKEYNIDESFIFKNACRLQRALLHKYKILMNRKEKLIQNINGNRSSHCGLTKKSSQYSSSLKTLSDKIQYLLQSIKTAVDRHGRVLSSAFQLLPSKIDYPDYYEIIGRPIDLKKIESRPYSSIDELSTDLQLMFDNACLYNEPGSTIYRDALTLQQILLNKRKQLTNAESNVHQVQNSVGNLIWNLFIQTFNYQDKNDRYYSDSFTDLPEQADSEPFDLIYTFDLIKQNLNRRRYRRLDVFQEDFFKVFQRARRLTSKDSQIYRDAIELQRYFIRLRDEICCEGNLLRSPALFYTEKHFEDDLRKETSNENSEIRQTDGKTQLSSQSTENLSFPKGETFYIGDFVYIESDEEKNLPMIVCIESFRRENTEEYLNGSQFLRPQETFHLPTKKFLRQEVFLTQTVENIPMKRIQGLCHVLHIKDYLKYQPMIENTADQSLKFEDLEKDVFVCESRYHPKTKVVKKIKSWNLPENKRVKLIPRETTPDTTRTSLNVNFASQPMSHQLLAIDNESIDVDFIEKTKETIPYDSVINEKLNENLPEKKQFYEQIVISSNVFYKVADYVYISEKNNNQSEKRSILRIEKIWKENDLFLISGPLFLRPCDIPNREQLIVTTKSSYERELIKCDDFIQQISLDQIKGKCSVLSLKHYCTCRLTEIAECDVFVCESKYIRNDQSLRTLSKSLKRATLSSKAFADEIWTFRKELLLHQDTPGGPFKVIDDGSFMDVDDQTNSNHASTIDGDEHQSNHLNFETANSSTTTNNTLNSPSTSNRNHNSSRKNNRRGSTARAPCGYLVFASESRKRLIKDNPGIPFGEMSRMIGDQWRRLTATERDKYEEKARERAREQEISQVNSTPSTPLANNSNNTSNNNTPTPTNNTPTNNSFETHSMPVINPQRIVNGGVTINGHYQANPNMSNVHQINGNITTVPKPPTAAVVTGPPRTQRLVHSEAYLRYIENLKTDNQFISDWPKQLKASMNNTTNTNNGNNGTRNLPSSWFSNNSPGLYNNVHEALWSMRDNMWSDVVRIRNVLSDEW